MKVWFIREGDNLPCDGENQKLFRVGLTCQHILSDDNNNVLWWTSEFNHAKKEHRSSEIVKDVKMAPNYIIRMLKSRGYPKNLSIKRIVHNISTAKLFSKLSQSEDKPDIIVASIPTIECAKEAVNYGLKNNVPVIIDIRDLWPDLYVDYSPRAIQWAVKVAIIPFKRKMSWLLRNATAIVATSDRFLEWGLNYANRSRNKDDRVFHVAYEAKDVKTDEDSITKWYEMGIQQKDFVCCFFGQFGNAVDVETVIEAAKMFSTEDKVKFVIGGVGEKLEKYKELSAGSKNVIYPGWLDQNMIAALGELSSIGLMAYVPNKNYEMSMPNKFGEYLSMGLAILLQPNGVMNDLIKQYNCGLHYSNAKELYDSIITLKNDPRLVQEMKTNSRKLYEARFDASKVYREYADYIVEIAKENKK